jgi:hypothetical protein
MSHHSHIAPPDLIRQDFHGIDAHETLRTTWPIEQLILIQSVEGHAQEGHGAFRGQRFVNTTMDDISRALRLDPDVMKADRQSLIDSISGYVTAVLSGNPPPGLLDTDNEPLLGISTLRYLSVAPMDVLRGLYLGGLRDDSDVRLQVETERGIKIGGGRGYLVDRKRMLEMGLNGDQLAHGDWAAEIERFVGEGLIVQEKQRNDPDVYYQYIRHRKGPGASDDAAIVAAGLLWGLGAAVGVFFADAIDTLEKYVPVCHDQDEEIALRIESETKNLGVGRDEVKTLTHVAVGEEPDGSRLPDSSLRHLMRLDRHHDMCAVEAHFLAVMGVPAPNIGLSHEHFPSAKFYKIMRERVEALGSHPPR